VMVFPSGNQLSATSGPCACLGAKPFIQLLSPSERLMQGWHEIGFINLMIGQSLLIRDVSADCYHITFDRRRRVYSICLCLSSFFWKKMCKYIDK
jgi:hypothetical protein